MSIIGEEIPYWEEEVKKQGSLTRQDEDELETKRLKAAMEAMVMLKDAQKEFTWDSVKPDNQVTGVRVKRLV